MENISINGHDYTIGRLDAFDQLHVSRKLSPLVPTIVPVIAEVAQGDLIKAFEKIDLDNVSDEEIRQKFDLKSLNGLSESLGKLTEAWASLPQDDVDFIIKKCLSVCNRNGSRVCMNGSIMFDDLDMMPMLALTVAVIRKNLGNFIQGLLTKAKALQQST
ncbi:phage tail assembly chaperone [Acinetobacter baumannii]